MWKLIQFDNDILIIYNNKGTAFGQIAVDADKKEFVYNGRDVERFPKQVQKDVNIWMETKCKENNFGGIWDIGAFMEW